MSVLVVVSVGALGRVAFGDPSHVENRSDQLSSSLPSATATNLMGFSITDASQPVGSIAFQFCEESPLPDYACTTPPGLNASAVTLAAQAGNVGFSIATNSTANTVILTRSPTTPTTGANTYQLDNIVNPNTQGTYYLRIYVYSTTDASGPETQNGGVALAVNNGVSVTAEVPPFLKFCTGITITNYDCSTARGYSINLGTLSSHTSSSATSQLSVATNAQSGFNITVTGTSLTSGNNVIPANTAPTPSILGSSQFGINLRANTQPANGADPAGSGMGQVTNSYNEPNRYTYQDGDTLVTSLLNSDNQTFTITYLANVSSQQAAGVYATTLTYICLANF
jgi:hypothetical protein